jgi:Spy/CpxP family protein refolding chaperone
MEENTMKKLAYVIAAICAIAVAAPSVANAEKIIIKRGHHHDWHHDRGYHNGWRHHDHDRVVIKHRY